MSNLYHTLRTISRMIDSLCENPEPELSSTGFAHIVVSRANEGIRGGKPLEPGIIEAAFYTKEEAERYARKRYRAQSPRAAVAPLTFPLAFSVISMPISATSKGTK